MDSFLPSFLLFPSLSPSFLPFLPPSFPSTSASSMHPVVFCSHLSVYITAYLLLPGSFSLFSLLFVSLYQKGLMEVPSLFNGLSSLTDIISLGAADLANRAPSELSPTSYNSLSIFIHCAITRYFRLLLYFSYLSNGSSHFSEVPEASFSKAWHLETRLVFQRRKSKWTKIT
jgi:hypothetical protein